MQASLRSLLILGVMSLSLPSISFAKNLPEPYASVELIPENPFGWYCNKKEIKKIFDRNNIKTVIEIGSWVGGGSTRHIAGLLKQRNGTLYAVDTWLGSPEHQVNQSAYQPVLPVVYEQFLSNMIHWGFTSVVVPIRMKSTDAANVLNVNPDLIYIDGEHSTEAVYADLQAWYPKAGPNCIVCGDDWMWDSVRAAVERFALENNKKIYASGNFWRLLN